jgi:ethanolamine ammonia-lyase large subunit
MPYKTTVGRTVYRFEDLKTVLAKATPERSGDHLAGIAAESAEERVAARMALADIPLKAFLEDFVIPYETDEITRLIVDRLDYRAFGEIASLTVGEFREWLLADSTDTETIARVSPGIMPEMAAAVSKVMRAQDLITAAKKIEVVSSFRNTIGLPGRLSVRLQPNHPTDDPKGVAASILDGLF